MIYAVLDMKYYGVPQAYLMPDALWQELEGFLPPEKTPSARGGRPGLTHRDIANGIYYRFKTGCQWNAIPTSFGSSSSLHRYFQEWAELGVWRNLHKWGLIRYDQNTGIDWTWQSLDASITKAPLGGQATGPNPTDRRKSGTKRHVLSDARGVPLSVTVSGANTPDHQKGRR